MKILFIFMKEPQLREVSDLALPYTKAWVYADPIQATVNEAHVLLSSAQCSSASGERYDINHHCASMDCYKHIRSGNTPQFPKHKTTPVTMQGWPSQSKPEAGG